MSVTNTKKEAQDARTMGQRLVNQWLANLGTAHERGQPVAYVFVMGNAIEIPGSGVSTHLHLYWTFRVNALQRGNPQLVALSISLMLAG